MELNNSDIWRTVPPEEKLEFLARAHAKGVQAVIGTLLVGGTVAVALQLEWLFWSSLLLIPFIFQFIAGKAWRGFRPRLMLEYLAARSAARRYAFANRARDLGLQLLFRGDMQRVFDSENRMAELEAAIDNTKEASVWIALFNDTIVLMSERLGGAKLEFAAPINERLSVQAVSPHGDDSPYHSDSSVLLTYRERRANEAQQIRITSRYPAALAVFERKLAASISNVQQLLTEGADTAAPVEKDPLFR